MDLIARRPAWRRRGRSGPILPQPGRHDHRRRRHAADRGRCEQRVETFDAGVAVAGALLGVAVGGSHGVIHIEIRDLVIGTRKHRTEFGEPGQHPRRDGVQLPNMTEPERAQERAQRRRCSRPGEQAAHRAVSQQAHVADRVGTSDHASHQRGDLRPSSRTGRARNRQQRARGLDQTGPMRQRHHRNQTRGRHEARIIEAREPNRSLMG